MKMYHYIITGLSGSIALTGLHEALKNRGETPRVDLLGQQAVEKLMGEKSSNFSGKTLYWSTLVMDIISNSVCYSIIAKAKRTILTGSVLGTLYGFGTVLIPDVLGLNKNYVKSSAKRRYMTIGYYAFGGLMAGLAAKAMETKNGSAENRPIHKLFKEVEYR